jgi:hypothetical protein
MTTETEKEKPTSIFLPQVSEATINEMTKTGDMHPEEISKVFSKENPYLFSLINFGLLFMGSSFVYWPLYREAQKQNRKLPVVSQKTIRDWQEKEVLFFNYLTNKGSGSKQPFLQSEFSLHSLEEFLPENPNLINQILLFDKGLQEASRKRNHPEVRTFANSAEFLGGALMTYELLRCQAEKDQLEKLFDSPPQ